MLARLVFFLLSGLLSRRVRFVSLLSSVCSRVMCCVSMARALERDPSSTSPKGCKVSASKGMQSRQICMLELDYGYEGSRQRRREDHVKPRAAASGGVNAAEDSCCACWRAAASRCRHAASRCIYICLLDLCCDLCFSYLVSLARKFL